MKVTPKANGNTNLFLSGERAQCITTYMSTRDHDKNKESIFIGQGYRDQRPGSKVVMPGTANPLLAGSIPAPASKF